MKVKVKKEKLKIKVPPYPNFEISENAHQRDVVEGSIQANKDDTVPNKIIMVVEFKTGEKKVIRARPVKYQNNTFISVFPNPIHIFLSTSIEQYNYSQSIKETSFLKYGKQVGSNTYLLDFLVNETNSCYNDYIKYRVSSIILLVSSLEAFLNHIISNDFIYRTIRNGEDKLFSKEDIESTKISFSEKMINVIPQWLNQPNFWDEKNDIKETLLLLYKNRKNIIHLKTNTQNDFERYFDSINEMLELDIFSSINSSIDFMNLVSKNFVEFDTVTKLI